MAKKEIGLGRGLDSLFLDNDIVEQEGYKQKTTIEVSKIEPKSDQPRKDFDEEALNQLAESIKTYGVLQPIIVREQTYGKYQIVAGERRWRAARLAQLDEIPAIIIDENDKTVAEIALIENIQREDLNPIEEAKGFKALMEEYGMTQEEVSNVIGKNRSTIANSLRLLELSDEILDQIAVGNLSAGHARAVLSINNEDARAEFVNIIISTGMSVRKAEEYAKKLNKNLEKQEKTNVSRETKPVSVDYIQGLENKMMDKLGRKVEISATKRKKTLTLSYENDEDLNNLIELLCGSSFLEEI